MYSSQLTLHTSGGVVLPDLTASKEIDMTNFIVFFDTNNHEDGFDHTYIDANTDLEAERIAKERFPHGSKFMALTGPEYDEWVEQQIIKTEAEYNI
jgi:hypothetical protein